MKSLKYKGAIYTCADIKRETYQHFKNPNHERCPRGTHWNTDQKKCMKLPPDLAKTVSRAHATSKQAESTGDPKDHRLADLRHQRARNQASKHGFAELANYHCHLSAYHSYKR